MDLYAVVYRAPDGTEFKRLIFAHSDEQAMATAKLAIKRNVIISLEKIHSWL